MTRDEFLPYAGGLWLLDTEYATPPGDPVVPVCLTAKEVFSGRVVRMFFEEGGRHENPFLPYEDKVFVAFAAHAEWSCFLSLGWSLPVNIVDLHTEFRNEISGRTPPNGYRVFDTSLVGAMDYFHLNHIDAGEKRELQLRISRGYPFTSEEREGILNYCLSDVVCLEKLLHAMAYTIELPYALFRGVHSRAVAHMERNGIPVDREGYERMVRNREQLKARLIRDYEAQHGQSPYMRDRRGDFHFSHRRFESYLGDLGLLKVWRKTPHARLKTDQDYWDEMGRRFLAVRPLAKLVLSIGDLRQFGLMIGSDDRARYPVMPFHSDTGRNQPKAKRFLFLQSSWMRSFVKPAPGRAICYTDWSAAEFLIAGVLSGDKEMLKVYASGDPYLSAAVSMGFAPQGATKETHGTERSVFKIWLLSAQYGATAGSLVRALPAELAAKVPDPLYSAKDFLGQHNKVFMRYWDWAEGHVELFIYDRNYVAQTCFGWRCHHDRRKKPWQVRTKMLNFPMQSTCAEILRWACVYAVEDGIEVMAPVHDALLVGGTVNGIEEVAARTKAAMDKASTMVLGLAMRTDAKIVRYPERFRDPRGAGTWDRIMGLVEEIEGAEVACE